MILTRKCDMRLVMCHVMCYVWRIHTGFGRPSMNRGLKIFHYLFLWQLNIDMIIYRIQWVK